MKKEKKIPLSDLRKTKGFSQKEFATELGVSSALIALYEVGKRKPKLERAIMIAEYFDIPVENILFGKCDFAEIVPTNQSELEQKQGKQMTIFDLDKCIGRVR